MCGLLFIVRFFSRPFGTYPINPPAPRLKWVGYLRFSLRDSDRELMGYRTHFQISDCHTVHERG